MRRAATVGSWMLLGFALVAGAVVAVSGDAALDDVLMPTGGPAIVLAILGGIRLHRPRRVVPWLALAGAGVAICAGDVAVTSYGTEAPYPSVADALWLSAYIGIIGAIVGFLRAGGGGRDRAAVLDAAIVSVAATTLSWTYLLDAYAHDPTLSFAAKAVSISYVVADLALLLAIARLALGTGPGGTSTRMLMCGFVIMIATDSAYGWQGLTGTYVVGGALDGAYVVAYGCLAAMALHPSMRRMTEPVTTARRERLGAWRVAVLAAAALVIPLVQVTGALAGREMSFAALGAGSACLFGLVCLRLAGLMRFQTAARDRETVLRGAGEALVAARGVADVHRAVLQAARTIAGHDRVALVDVREDVPAGAWALPLLLRDESRGHLVVDVAPTRPGVGQALRTLAREAALALESVASVEEAVRRDAEARLAALIRHASDVVVVAQPDGTCTYASPSVTRVLGHQTADLLGRPLLPLVHPDDTSRARAFVERAVQTPSGSPGTGEFRIAHADGTWRDVEVLAANLLDDPVVGGLVLNMREVSERKAFERELAHRAFHDALTGLPNRALFRDRVEQALARARRDGTTVAVLMLDLDDMKWVNDSLGHAAGDALLREVAERLARTARAADTVARLGGDEYAILLEGSADPMLGVAVAERVLEALMTPVTIDAHAFPARASIGVAHAELRGSGAHDADVLLRNADAAMYVAKEAGKGRYRVFEDAMHDEALARLALKNDLQRALERGEFHLEYQPVVALDTGRIAGLEALLRWRHPDRGLVSPAEFVPLAEETGVIVAIGEWVLREACAHAARLHAAAPQDPPVGISVNVSARQLQRREIVEDVREAIAASGIPASSLTLELTETVLVSDVDLAVLRLHELRSIGVSLAIDDFGTGYSSLTYLRHFPLDVLKVDKSFVDDVDDADGTGPLTAAILDLARVLGLRAVAEGIEDPRQIDVLRRLGCDLGQGYALYRPLTADASEAAVRAQPLARAR